ncbi:transcriptional regulator [Klebsiella grimontii]|nr:transcriptional regulator [Klebsiella grimontii]
MRGSDFAELKAFAMVVEQGSFTRAAAHLGVTTSTLSATIRRLEERIGVRLLHRTTRSVAPSEAGKRMMQRLAPALAALEDAVTDAQTASAPAGRLRLNVSRIAAIHYLAPVLGGFMQRYPKMSWISSLMTLWSISFRQVSMPEFVSVKSSIRIWLPSG